MLVTHLQLEQRNFNRFTLIAMFKTKRIQVIVLFASIIIFRPLIHAVILIMINGNDESLPGAHRSDLLFLLYESPIWVCALLASAMEIQRRRILGLLNKMFVVLLFTLLGFSTPLAAFMLSPMPENVSFILLVMTSLSGLFVGLISGYIYWVIVR